MPVLAVTVRVAPVPVTPVIGWAPPRPVLAKREVAGVHVVTDSLNVTVQLTLAALVGLRVAVDGGDRRRGSVGRCATVVITVFDVTGALRWGGFG